MGRRITGMRRSAIRVLFTVLSIGAAVCAVTAQTARQGEAGERTGFASPMVLESVFAPAMPSHAKDEPWFSIDEYHDLGKYSCDGVFIRKGFDRHENTWEPGLEMAVRDLKDGRLEVKAKATVDNPRKNHDKKIVIVLEVLNGSDVVGKAQIGPIKCEEGDESSKQATLVLARETLRSDPVTRMRLTMTTEDD